VGIRVRFESGPAAGTSQEFGDDVEEIRFGREPQDCHVVFPPNETRVSRQHFAVRHVLGQYRLVTNHVNPVFVNGEVGHDEQILDALSEIQVGRHGPRIVLEATSASRLVGTQARGEKQPGAHTRLVGLASDVRASRRAIAAAGGAIVLAGVAGIVGYRIAVHEAEKASLRFDAFGRVFANASPSVYLVVVRQAVGDASVVKPFATAWVVDDANGLLATNVHVARMFGTTSGGTSIALRSTSEPSQELAIEGVSVHPGYDAFESLLNATAAYDPSSSSDGRLRLFAGADVALLKVAESDRAKLARKLPLATEAEVESLSVGQCVAFVGFPSEGIAHAGIDVERPRPRFEQTTVTGLSDFFLGSADARERQLVHVGSIVVGGASGSPILDEHGHVVAVLSSSNLVAGEGSMARQPIGGAYGQRVDLLRELLDGRAPSAQAARTERWRGEFEKLYKNGVDGQFVRVCRSFESQLRDEDVRVGEPRVVLARTVTLAGSAESDTWKATVRFDFDGWFLFVALAEKQLPIEMIAFVNGVSQSPLPGLDAFPAEFARARAGESASVEVSSRNPAAAGTQIRLRVYGFPVAAGGDDTSAR
jgi:trypsin-like peptidase